MIDYKKNFNYYRHNLMVLSIELVARMGKVGWNATDKILSVCAGTVAKRVGFCRSEQSHNFIVLSQEPDAKNGKVGWNATE